MGNLLSALPRSTASEPTADSEPTDVSAINADNPAGSLLPKASDVVVVGGGIHSLVYAIQARQLELKAPTQTAKPTSIIILEKSLSLSYKIGESTLTVFGLWLKTIGIDPPLLWRLFGPKDGLAFYYLSRDGDPEAYTQFVANGPPGDFVPTLQIERKISELLLTIYAQRLGVTVLHGKEVDVDGTELSGDGHVVRVKDRETEERLDVKAELLIDATGRFHRFVSKTTKERVERPEGLNTDAFWAYFECVGDESEIPLRHYESVNTNHICLPEGWAWVIRLPSWEGNPLPNLIAMINHLLDLNSTNTPPDAYPAVSTLLTKFSLKMRWVTSIGFALRRDVTYPSNLHQYGTCEASRKFNWIVSLYPKLQQLVSHHVLIPNLYGPSTTWYIRKNLSFRAPSVTGSEGWAAIGDATGFTNPLYSPGINVGMATGLYVTEMTRAYLASGREGRIELLAGYEGFCAGRIGNLTRMNTFNYLCMRSPELGPLGPLWQYLCGTGNAAFQNAKTYDFNTAKHLLMTWNWGANEPSYITFADQVMALLDGPPTPPSREVIEAVKALSEKMMREVLATGKYKGRWAGLLRWYDNELNFVEGKDGRDVLARRCEGCGEWRMLREDARRCAFCGFEHEESWCEPVLFD